MSGFTGISEWKQVVRFLIFLALFWSVTACDSQRNEYVEPPPPKVTVAQPLQQEVIEYLEFTGTAHAFEEAEIQARVSGFFAKHAFYPRHTG